MARVFFLLVLFASLPARAQSPADLRAARELFRDGLAQANAGHWQEARERFERSFAIAPRLPTLLNLAGAQVQTGQLVSGVESYRRFISEAQGGREASFVDQAREALSAAEARLAHVVVRATLGDDDTVSLDGDALAAASLGTDVPVDPGAHTLTLTHDGQERDSEAVTLTDGQRREITLAGAVDLHVAHSGTEAQPPADHPAGGGDDTGVWVAVGISIAVVVIAAVVIGVYFGVADANAPYMGNLGPGMIQFD